MDKFSLAIIVGNLDSDVQTLTLDQLLIYINEVLGSDLPFADKVKFTKIIKEKLVSKQQDVNDYELIIKLAKALGQYDYQ